MVNFAELDRVIAHCAAHPEQHSQALWFDIHLGWADEDEGELADDWQCHTTACLAGWTAILNGWRPVNPNSTTMVNERGWANPVSAVAQKILGLTSEQAHQLFTQSLDLGEVRRMVDRIRVEEGAGAR